MLYFAYGSNMLTGRLKERVPSSEKIATARLPGYKLSFHKQGTDGSGKCSIQKDADSAVFGIVYDIDPGEKPILDSIEGPGYKQDYITVYTENKTLEPYTYIARKDFREDLLNPYSWYRTLVLEGAIEHQLPDDYIEMIKEVETENDPNEERARRELKIVG